MDVAILKGKVLKISKSKLMNKNVLGFAIFCLPYNSIFLLDPTTVTLLMKHSGPSRVTLNQADCLFRNMHIYVPTYIWIYIISAS